MLRDMQSAVARHVLTRGEAEADLHAMIVADGIDPAERLSIHRNNVMGSLIEVLADTFGAVARHCGTHNFQAAAGAYVRERPPARAQLSHYGADFADFLDDYAPARRDLPFLADLARLEWALNEAYFAAEANPLAPDGLSRIPPARLGEVRLGLHPATRIVASPHPVYNLWRPEAGDEEGRHVLVVRPEAVVDAFPIGAGDHGFVTALAAGAPLAEAVDAGLAVDPGFDLQRALRDHLRRGTFCGADL